MDRTSSSGFAPFFWPLLYKSQSWFLAGWIYGQNLKFWFCTFLLASTLQVPELVSGGLDLWTEPQILVLHLSFGLYPTSPRAGFWRVGSMDRTSNSGFEPFFWPLPYKSQSLNLSFGLYSTSPRAGFWRVGAMDRTSNSGFEPFFWPLLYNSQSWFLALDLWTEPQILVLPLLYKSQSWFLAGWIYGHNLKFWF